MEHFVLKLLHVSSVALSYALFVMRGVWMVRESELLRRRWVKIVPHVIETGLLASAIALTIILGQYPFVHGWLTAKVAGLLFYIALGMAALRFGKTRRTRIAAWLAAQAVFFISWRVGSPPTRRPGRG